EQVLEVVRAGRLQAVGQLRVDVPAARGKLAQDGDRARPVVHERAVEIEHDDGCRVRTIHAAAPQDGAQHDVLLVVGRLRPNDAQTHQLRGSRHPPYIPLMVLLDSPIVTEWLNSSSEGEVPAPGPVCYVPASTHGGAGPLRRPRSEAGRAPRGNQERLQEASLSEPPGPPPGRPRRPRAVQGGRPGLPGAL